MCMENVKFFHWKGEMEIDGDVRSGIVKIGISDPLRSSNSISIIQNLGTIKFGACVVLRRGIVLGCQPNSEISFGNDTYIGDNVSIIQMSIFPLEITSALLTMLHLWIRIFIIWLMLKQKKLEITKKR